MFINAIPYWFARKPGLIHLPTYITAPLGLANGTKLWVAFQSRSSQKLKDIIFSPYPPSSWPDMWRLELQLWDKPGQLFELVRLLDDLGITILHLTSRDAFEKHYHSKYLMLDCSSYTSLIDGKTTDRTDRSFDLRGLRATVLARFLRHTRLSPKDGKPWISISRNLVHFDMAQANLASSQGSDYYLHTDPLEITDSRLVDISPIAPGFIKERLSSSYPALSTNTKSQVIYGSLMDKQGHACEHIVVYYSFQHGRGVLRKLLDKLRDGKINIVRSQLRYDVIGAGREVRFKYEELNTIRSWGKAYTLNMLVMNNSSTRDTFGYIQGVLLRDLVTSREVVVKRLPVRAPNVPKRSVWPARSAFSKPSQQRALVSHGAARDDEDQLDNLNATLKELDEFSSRFAYDGDEPSDFEARCRLALRLSHELRGIVRDRAIPSELKKRLRQADGRRVFLSHTFENGSGDRHYSLSFWEAFRNAARQARLEPMRGDWNSYGLPMGGNLPRDILARMSEAEAFLFAWTEDKAGSARPSDWMIFESGIAAANKRPMAHVYHPSVANHVEKHFPNQPRFVVRDGESWAGHFCDKIREAVGTVVELLDGGLGA